MSTLSLQVFADYHHFILQDAAAAEATGWEALRWTADALARKLAVAPTLIAIGTGRADTVPVELVVADAPPPAEVDADAELVTVASVEVPSGCLVCTGPTGYLPDAPRVALTPGTYAARVAYRGLATVSADGLDGDDRYRVTLWPAAAAIAPRVVADRRG